MGRVFQSYPKKKDRCEAFYKKVVENCIFHFDKTADAEYSGRSALEVKDEEAEYYIILLELLFFFYLSQCHNKFEFPVKFRSKLNLHIECRAMQCEKTHPRAAKPVTQVEMEEATEIVKHIESFRSANAANDPDLYPNVVEAEYNQFLDFLITHSS